MSVKSEFDPFLFYLMTSFQLQKLGLHRVECNKRMMKERIGKRVVVPLLRHYPYILVVTLRNDTIMQPKLPKTDFHVAN